ncbi:MAG: SRPBCC family protein [Bacteroidota bacterium]
MKFKGAIEINKPTQLVAELFADPTNLKEWQDGFVKKELQSGNEGEARAVSKMYYAHGGRNMILTETIVSNELPHSFEAFYHHKRMDNSMKCTFAEIAPNKTQYKYEFEYTRINWFMPRLVAILFPGMYRKQGEKWMNQFKEFVEKQ